MTENYTLTVGLEIHAQLATKTKMFCNSANDPNEKRPNVNICPVCMGHPGTLPVINKEAVRSVLRLGVAVGGNLADYTEFDRKNYFYPDIPKGYQISQYKHPLVKGGEVAGVALTRIHLEEDTARSTHPEGREGRDWSLLDFNRAGVPLMELVTEPVITSAQEAGNFARELQLIVVYLGISEANMEKGEMRIEANVSVTKNSKFEIRNSKLGTKVEVKNLNSFKAVEKAIKYEYERQVAMLEKGEGVAQETRGWDDSKGETFSQRAKEESHDYRYFPDPDLPKLFISEIPEFDEKALRETLPELPQERREKLVALGLNAEHVEYFTTDKDWGDYFDKVVRGVGDRTELAKLSANYIASDLKSTIDQQKFIEVMVMLEEGLLSSRGAKDLLIILQEGSDGEPRKIAEEKNLIQESNTEELRKIAEKVISANEKVAEEYRGGKEASLQYLVGQAMRESKGSGNPKVLRKLLEEALSSKL